MSRVWTMKRENGDEISFWEHGIACIQWLYDEAVSQEPDRSHIILTSGQTIDLFRANTRILYHDIKSEERQ